METDQLSFSYLSVYGLNNISNLGSKFAEGNKTDCKAFVNYFTIVKHPFNRSLITFSLNLSEGNMPGAEQVFFQLLKKEVGAVFRHSHPECLAAIEEWKGSEIEAFQDDLMVKVQGRISEKWFYTHIKSRGHKLPRIDMLDLLSAYVGHHNWADFKNRHAATVKELVSKNQGDGGKWLEAKYWLPVLLLVVGIVGYLFIFGLNNSIYRFCFVDADRNELMQNTAIDVLIRIDSESPILKKVGPDGCFEWESEADHIEFVVRSPYYKTDTIKRTLNKNDRQEFIKLQTDDYALMIHYFSKDKVKDWKARKAQLDKMFHDNARIYQVYAGTQKGMELYNKKEFIRKLTMPIESLKNIEILKTTYIGDKIAVLRFKQLTTD